VRFAMACWRLQPKSIFVSLPVALMVSSCLLVFCTEASAQSGNGFVISQLDSANGETGNSSTHSFELASSSSSGPVGDGLPAFEDRVRLPEAPDPGEPGGNPERYSVAPTADWRQPAFSRIGIGADLNPLGIGIKSAIVLNPDFDARVMANFFNFNPGRFEVEGFNAYAHLHMASLGATLDCYPFNSVWRLSAGLLLYNGNQLSGTTEVAPGTSFTLDGNVFYSASVNATTGASPVMGTGTLGLHTNRPAAMVSGGFGKFVPRSNRHWSFPVELGVAFTGAPTFNVSPSGWVCKDKAETQCSNIGDPADPVAIEFNNSLQETLTKFRKGLAKVPVYPLFSYSVVYSFNIR
jgi:hypothetical protein